MRPSSDAILIAGGGIGGLSAALALADAGFDVHLLERAETFSEVGAGLQLGPNATRILHAWGVLDKLKDSLVFPSFVGLHDGREGELLTRFPLGIAAEHRYGAPYVILHRADLQRGLLETARWNPRIQITTGFEVAQVARTPRGLAIHSPRGAMLEAPALIAADGIASRLRERVAPKAALAFAGKSAWRALVPAGELRGRPVDPSVSLWMGPGAHLVHYPVRGGEAVNVVAVVEDNWHGEGWDEAGDPEDLLPHFRGWSPAPLELLHAADRWRKWALYTMPPLLQWSAGGIVLLGDAAHPVLPFLAQGAALAIEDAAVLADAVATEGAPTRAAFARYEEQRQARAARVQAAAKRMGGIYAQRGPARWVRNTMLRYGAAQTRLQDFDWLYGYQAPLLQRAPAA